MSDVTTNATNNSNTSTKEALKFEIKNHPQFKSVHDTALVTPSELTSKINAIMRNVFVDFEGSHIRPVPNGNLMVELFFNHKDYKDEDGVRACEIATANGIKNSVLKTMVNNEYRMRYGDRYNITDEAQELLKPFFMPEMFNSKGDLVFSKIVAEVADNQTNLGFGMMRVQLTMISGLDLTKFVSLIYGSKTFEDSESYTYAVHMTRSVANPTNVSNVSPFIIAIDRYSDEQVAELAQKFGLAVSNGLNIDRQ